MKSSRFSVDTNSMRRYSFRLASPAAVSPSASKKSSGPWRSIPSGKMYLKMKSVSVHLGEAESTMMRCATCSGCRAAYAMTR